MAQIKITKEELKHDEFIDATDKFFLWLKNNFNLILVVLIVVFAVVAGRQVLKQRSDNAAAGASAIYGTAIADYNEALAKTDWGTLEREQALSGLMAQVRQLEEEYPGSYLAAEGLYLLGSAYFSTGDDMRTARSGGGIPNTERAIDAFSRYTAQSQPNSVERARGQLALAYANENAFFLTDKRSYLDDAMQTYSEVVSNPAAGFLADEARLAMARIRTYVLDDREGAIELYREVMDNRWRPAPAIPEEAPESEVLRQNLLRQFQEISLAQSAKIELLRLGVDVEAEYPTVERTPAP